MKAERVTVEFIGIVEGLSDFHSDLVFLLDDEEDE